MSVPDTTPDQVEEWRICRENENYEVSSFGNVRNKKTGLLLASFNNNGYLATSLKSGMVKPSRQRVHRIVASAFCVKGDGKEYVNHIDGDKRNNRADNLEWVTNSENAKHYYTTHEKKVAVPIRITEHDGTVRDFKGINEAGRHYGLARATMWGYSIHGSFWGGRIERLNPVYQRPGNGE
jgi:hypothetical protein